MATPMRDRPVRVLRIITRLNVGGPAIQAVSLSTRLESAGFKTVLVYGRLSPGEGDMSYLLPEDGLDVVQIPSLRREVSPLHDARTFVRLFRLLRRFRPDIVHTHTAKAGALGRLATIAYNRTSARGAPAILVHTYHGHVHDGYFSAFVSDAFSATERLLARGTDAIVAISPAIRRELVEQHRIGLDHQYRTVPLGFDLAPFAAIDNASVPAARAELGIDPKQRVVAWVGRLTAIKQPTLLVETVGLLHSRFPDAVFLMVGDGELRETVEVASRAAGLGECLRLLGWRRNVARIYAASDAFVLTSRNEGTPVALIEALAAGVRSVSTDVGGVRDVLTDASLGTVVPDNDAAALADAVSKILDSPPESRRLTSAAREAITRRYGRDRLITDIVALYDELLRKRSTPQ